MKTTISVITVLLTLLAFTATAQTTPQPQYFLTVGAGFSQYTDPHFTSTGSFGVRVADGLYSVTALDMATKKTGVTRQTVSTIRTGAQKIVAQSGPFTLTVAGDVGLSSGAGNLTGAFSGGGAVAYSLSKRLAGMFLFGSVRIIKSPSSDPTANPATVATAFTFGVGHTF